MIEEPVREGCLKELVVVWLLLFSVWMLLPPAWIRWWLAALLCIPPAILLVAAVAIVCRRCWPALKRRTPKPKLKDVTTIRDK